MSTTGRDLVRRLRLLLVLATATTLALFFAYRGVHDDTVPLSTASTPGIRAVDTAQSALRQANAVVRETGAEGDTSGEFLTQVSVAQQSLALAASENVTGLAGRHDVQTVTGLIAVYSGWVERRGREPEGSPLRAAFLHYAEKVLGLEAEAGTEGDIMSRLDALRGEQLAEARRQAAFPGSCGSAGARSRCCTRPCAGRCWRASGSCGAASGGPCNCGCWPPPRCAPSACPYWPGRPSRHTER